MKYAVLFSVLGITCLVGAVGYEGWYWLMLWPGVSFFLVGFCYAGLGPGLFGKRADGRMHWFSLLILLPYLLLAWGTWHVRRWLVRKPALHQVRPGLYIGRRLLNGELPPDIAVVVDLTAEFPAAREMRQRTRYIACPCLDAMIPGEERVRELVELLLEEKEPILIHCANGHGRSAMLVAAVLMGRGEFSSVEETEKFLQSIRPGVGLTGPQKKLMQRLFPVPADSASPAAATRQ